MIRIKRVHDSPGPQEGHLTFSVASGPGEVGTPGFLKMFDDDDIRTEDFTGY
jgi:hypothetical protein